MESALVHNQSFSGAPRSAAHTSIEKCCPRSVAHTSSQKRCPQSVAHASSHPEARPRSAAHTSIEKCCPRTVAHTSLQKRCPQCGARFVPPREPYRERRTTLQETNLQDSISSGGCSNHSCEKSQPQREDHANGEASISGAETRRKEPPGFNSESEVISHPGLGIPSHPSLGIPE